MCGIAGYFAPPGRDAWRAAFPSLLESLRPRGPDDGAHIFRESPCGVVALGHRRLSIRDLSAAGRQPMANETERIFLVCNGEIYNAEALRAQLERAGHRVRSQSDSEVILHGFEEWGIAVLERLNGMFAFGLWDDSAQSLYLARDPLGIKPLLYIEALGGIVFSSEQRGLLDWPGLDPAIDLAALHEYLSFGYTHTPRTLVREIRKLPPGCYLKHDARRGSSTIAEYWSLEAAFRRGAADHAASAPGNAPASELWERLRRSVSMQCVSDVPLGSFLSGGIDSSAIAACFAAESPAGATFCCDFAEETFSEGRAAARVAASVGLSHHHYLLSPPAAAAMPALIRAADEPFADTSFVAYHGLARYAREHVTVALSGDGADELLAGYITYAADGYHALLGCLPYGLRAWLAGAVAPRVVARSAKVGAAFKLRQFLSAAAEPRARAHAYWRALWWQRDLASVLTRDARRRLAECASDPFAEIERRFVRVGDLPFLEQALFVDLSTWMLDDILHKVDRASMAHGLEVRVPYLDHTLVEWCAALPSAWKRSRGRGKRVLREAVRRHAPHLAYERKKLGFNAPVGSWLNGSLRAWSDERLANAREICGDWLDVDAVEERFLAPHRAGAADYSFKLWSLLWLVGWMEETGVRLSAAAAAAAARAPLVACGETQ
ncbi:MAG: asparagine synthase (glutamine-hydrolyzing) [Planctomycetes bacterium]|nr:asparagine synthase (glutamine-hydrolyzing) [Planctomycetota bacterium]